MPLLLIHSVEMRIKFEYSNVTIQSYHLRLPFHYPLRWQLQTTEEGTPVLELLYSRSYYHWKQLLYGQRVLDAGTSHCSHKAAFKWWTANIWRGEVNIKILEQFGNKNIFNDANSYRDIYIINRRFENYVDIGYLHTNTKCVLIFGFLAISRYLCSCMTDHYCFEMSRALI